MRSDTFQGLFLICFISICLFSIIIAKSIIIFFLPCNSRRIRTSQRESLSQTGSLRKCQYFKRFLIPKIKTKTLEKFTICRPLNTSFNKNMDYPWLFSCNNMDSAFSKKILMIAFWFKFDFIMSAIEMENLKKCFLAILIPITFVPEII